MSLIHLQHVEEGRFMREHLEKEVVKLACRMMSGDDLFQMESNLKMQELCASQHNFSKLFELDEDFHRTIFKGAGKLRTWSVIQVMNTHFNRIRMLRLSANDDWDIILSQHAAIFNSIKEKNEEKAEKVMKEHLNLIRIEQDELKKKYPTYFRS